MTRLDEMIMSVEAFEEQARSDGAQLAAAAYLARRDPAPLALYRGSLEQRGLAASTIDRRLSTDTPPTSASPAAEQSIPLRPSSGATSVTVARAPPACYWITHARERDPAGGSVRCLTDGGEPRNSFTGGGECVGFRREFAL
jgi:hypothetical protein